MVTVDTAASIPGTLQGSINAGLNAAMGLFILIQTIARIWPTPKTEQITSVAGKILNFIFLHSKTITGSQTGTDTAAPSDGGLLADVAASDDVAAPAADTSASDAAKAVMSAADAVKAAAEALEAEANRK